MIVKVLELIPSAAGLAPELILCCQNGYLDESARPLP
jgi:hypothetical protein